MRTRFDMEGNYVERKRLTSPRGQVAVEYVLLLITGVAIASLIVSLVVSRSDTNPGFLVIKWQQIIDMIGSDVIDP